MPDEGEGDAVREQERPEAEAAEEAEYDDDDPKGGREGRGIPTPATEPAIPPSADEPPSSSPAKNSKSSAQYPHTGGSGSAIPTGLSVQGGGVRGT